MKMPLLMMSQLYPKAKHHNMSRVMIIPIWTKINAVSAASLQQQRTYHDEKADIIETILYLHLDVFLVLVVPCDNETNLYLHI